MIKGIICDNLYGSKMQDKIEEIGVQKWGDE
jgi:hypothetical protein